MFFLVVLWYGGRVFFRFGHLDLHGILLRRSFRCLASLRTTGRGRLERIWYLFEYVT